MSGSKDTFRLRLGGWRVTFVIDAEGRIRHKYVGPLTREILEGNVLPDIRALSQ